MVKDLEELLKLETLPPPPVAKKSDKKDSKPANQ
jgi:hypothetical protein